jgi:hypothetical protein
VPNSAVRLLAGVLTVVFFLLFLMKIGWYRTNRKIVYILLVAWSWIGTTCWLVLAGWDANEIRVATNECRKFVNYSCHFEKYIGLVIVDIGLWIIGWVFSIIFSVWLKKQDYLQPAGLCGHGRRSRVKGAQALSPMPSAPGAEEMEDF